MELLRFGMAVESKESRLLAIRQVWTLESVDKWIRLLFSKLFRHLDHIHPLAEGEIHWKLYRKCGTGLLVPFPKEEQEICGADLSRAIVTTRVGDKVLYFGDFTFLRTCSRD